MLFVCRSCERRRWRWTVGGQQAERTNPGSRNSDGGDWETRKSWRSTQQRQPRRRSPSERRVGIDKGLIIAQRVAFLKTWKTREANRIAHKADRLATGPEAREKQRAHFKEEKLRLEGFMVHLAAGPSRDTRGRSDDGTHGKTPGKKGAGTEAHHGIWDRQLRCVLLREVREGVQKANGARLRWRSADANRSKTTTRLTQERCDTHQEGASTWSPGTLQEWRRTNWELCGPSGMSLKVGCCGNPGRLSKIGRIANMRTRALHSTTVDGESEVQCSPTAVGQDRQPCSLVDQEVWRPQCGRRSICCAGGKCALGAVRGMCQWPNMERRLS